MKTIAMLVATCAGALGATAAFAEGTPRANGLDDGSDWLTVHAPRILRRPAARGISSNEQIVYLSNRVNYAGLNLALHADVLELRRRIVESATVSCEQLAVLSPFADLDTAECVREAIDDAMVRAREVVAAAMAANATE